MKKHDLACYILEVLYNMKTKWVNTNHGEYKNMMKCKKFELEDLYKKAVKVRTTNVI